LPFNFGSTPEVVEAAADMCLQGITQNPLKAPHVEDFHAPAF
jgi:hypothetical protein